MRASVVMMLAVVLFILHRWATNKPAVNLPIILSGIFVIFVIGLLDQGKTESIAKGFAWLFFLVAAYTAIPAFTGAMASAKAGVASGAVGEGLHIPGSFNVPGGG